MEISIGNQQMEKCTDSRLSSSGMSSRLCCTSGYSTRSSLYEQTLFLSHKKGYRAHLCNKTPSHVLREESRKVPSWICAWGAVICFQLGLKRCNAVIFSTYFLRKIFLCKEGRSGLTKRNSITDKIGMTTNPSTPTEVFCPLITILR